MTINEFLDDVDARRGQPGGWPSCYNYNFLKGEENIIITLSITDKLDLKKTFRQFDPWGLVFTQELQEETGLEVKTITFSVKDSDNKINKTPNNKACYESLLRRISFISFNNSQQINIKLIVNNKEQVLYSKDSLFDNRPESDVIGEAKNQRDDDDIPDRLEKDFQAFLYGKGLEREQRTNERLAILGADFFKLKKKQLGITREFPTGVFAKEKNEQNRILPTYFIDLISLNKYGALAVIELKVNDTKLEVISQILDYALYVRCYRSKILPILDGLGIHVRRNQPIVCYVANNLFHEKFDSIQKYYNTIDKEYGFVIKKVVLGSTKVLGSAEILN